MSELHYPHDKQPPIWKEDYYQVAGIDPAVKSNLCFWIERRYVLTGRVETLIAKHKAFDDLPEGLSPHAWITKFFDIYFALFNQCHMVLIEKQQVTENIKGMLIGQDIIAYFITKLRNNPLCTLIYEVNSRMKTHEFAGPTGPDVKPWAVAFVIELLALRKDSFSIQLMHTFPRVQDSCDIKLMIEAFFKHHSLATQLSQQAVKCLTDFSHQITKTESKVESKSKSGKKSNLSKSKYNPFKSKFKRKKTK